MAPWRAWLIAFRRGHHQSAFNTGSAGSRGVEAVPPSLNYARCRLASDRSLLAGSTRLNRTTASRRRRKVSPSCGSGRTTIIAPQAVRSNSPARGAARNSGEVVRIQLTVADNDCAPPGLPSTGEQPCEGCSCDSLSTPTERPFLAITLNRSLPKKYDCYRHDNSGGASDA
jgi:hypothetical protein